MGKIKIAISGELGSGKTVLSKKLSAILGMEVISIGKIQRKLAHQHGMSTLEFNKHLETHPEIDEEFDDAVSKYGLEKSELILDSRLAWYFVPNSFKVHLLVDSAIAAKRIFKDNIRKNEKYNSVEEAHDKLIKRKNSEIIRFMQQYGVNIDNLNNYDIVIDTGYSSPDKVVEKVLEAFDKWKKHVEFNHIYFSPKSLLPTQSIREHSLQYTKDISESMKKKGFSEDSPVIIFNYLNEYFIYDGHKRVSSAIYNNFNFIPCILIGNEDNKLPTNQSVIEYLSDNYSIKNIYDWEAMHQFYFPKYILAISK